jgi:hypothetical protein
MGAHLSLNARLREIAISKIRERIQEKNMCKAFACDTIVIDDGDERLLRYCVSEVSELDARETLERYLKDQRWDSISVRQIRAATPGEAAEYKLPVGGIKLML